MPCLPGQPHPPDFLVEEQLAVISVTTMSNNEAILIDCFIIFWLQFKLFLQIIIIWLHG